jgi:hypothetical protein
MVRENAGQDIRDMCSPPFERFLALGHELVPLVHRSYARDRSGLVVQNLVGYVGGDAKTGHPWHARPPKIVKAPSGDTRYRIEFALGVVEVLTDASQRPKIRICLASWPRSVRWWPDLTNARCAASHFLFLGWAGSIAGYQDRTRPKRNAPPLPGAALLTLCHQEFDDEQGRGVAQNYREAMRWFRLAALQGDASAQSNLGVMLLQNLHDMGALRRLPEIAGAFRAATLISLIIFVLHSAKCTSLSCIDCFHQASSRSAPHLDGLVLLAHGVRLIRPMCTMWLTWLGS